MNLFKKIIKPITNAPLFFALLVILGSIAAILSVAAGEPHRWILVYAICQNALYAYVVCLLALAIKGRWFRVLCSSIAALFAIVEIMHRVLMFGPVTYDSVMVTLATNPMRVQGFIIQFFTPAIILLCLGIILVVTVGIWLIVRSDRPQTLPLWLTIPTLCLIALGVYWTPRNFGFLPIRAIDKLIVWQHAGRNDEMCNLVRINYASPLDKILYYHKLYSLDRQMDTDWLARQQQVLQEPPTACTADSTLQVAIIIGESFIKSHSSLYGYHLQTNPRLEREAAEGLLTPFSDMICAANFTVMSIRNAMNLNTLPEPWYDAPYVPLIFARNGWQVNLFTNQYAHRTYQFGLGAMLYSPFMVEHCYAAHNEGERKMDLDFLQMVTDSIVGLDTPRPRTLDIWHLKGQHFPPINGYTPEFAHFTASDVPANKPWLDDRKRAIVADYANATLYNDSVVSRIIDLYRGSNAVVLYFSDHGEEMYDTAPFGNRNRQRPEEPDWMHRQFDVPFFVWLSPQADAALQQQILKAKDRPGTLDNLPQMLLGLGGLSAYPLYRPEFDILSPAYKPKPRITGAGFHYPE